MTKQSFTMEQLAARCVRDIKKMTPKKKAECRQHLVKAFCKQTDREFYERNIFVAPNCVVKTLREMKQPVTRETYAEMAYWKPYRKLTAEEKFEVREAVYEANIQ